MMKKIKSILKMVMLMPKKSGYGLKFDPITYKDFSTGDTLGRKFFDLDDENLKNNTQLNICRDLESIVKEDMSKNTKIKLTRDETLAIRKNYQKDYNFDLNKFKDSSDTLLKLKQSYLEKGDENGWREHLKYYKNTGNLHLQKINTLMK